MAGLSVFSGVMVRHFGQAGIRKSENLGPDGLGATAATSALDNGADVAKARERLRHSSIRTARVHERRGPRDEDLRTLKFRYWVGRLP